MRLISIIKRGIENPQNFYLSLLMHIARFINSDSLFVSAMYKLYTGEKLNLRNPKTFNEKTQWLKVYDHNPLYHDLVDKYEVKKYVEKVLGGEYIIPTIGVWDSFDDIDFDLLPKKFVLKSTNGGGSTGVVICSDKASFDISDAKRKLEASMSYDIYRNMGEWVYKNIKPKIIAEEFLELPNGKSLNDYKFWCFNGSPKVLFYASERFNDEKRPPYFDYYDMELNRLPLRSRGHQNSPIDLEIFPEFEQMKKIAEKLAGNIPFVRVDLYNVAGKILFGEMTFYHDSGFVPFDPKSWDVEFGSWLDINN